MEKRQKEIVAACEFGDRTVLIKILNSPSFKGTVENAAAKAIEANEAFVDYKYKEEHGHILGTRISIKPEAAEEMDAAEEKHRGGGEAPCPLEIQLRNA